jgi:hypothetical protein
MSSIFCCPNTTPYKSRTLSHESKFQTFTSWAQNPKTSSIGTFPDPSSVTLAIQLVKQVNYGPLESKRYFVESGGEFVEVAKQWVVDANFQKLDTYVSCTVGWRVGMYWFAGD